MAIYARVYLYLFTHQHAHTHTRTHTHTHTAVELARVFSSQPLSWDTRKWCVCGRCQLFSDGCAKGSKGISHWWLAHDEISSFVGDSNKKIQVLVWCGVLQGIRSVLQGVAGCCIVLQCVAMHCSMLQCVFLLESPTKDENSSFVGDSNLTIQVLVLQCGAVCCRGYAGCCGVLQSVLQCVAVCCSRVRCRVLQSVAMCCNVLQCIAMCVEQVSDPPLSTQGVAVWCSVCCSASQCVPTSQKICLTIPFRRRTFAGGFPALMCGSNQVLYIVLGSGSCMVLQCAAVCCSVCSVW